ncbi:MAG: hypothetical protein FWG77_07215 [Treponema sp.]|nr:hypothetical protein [Treponema sp.]
MNRIKHILHYMGHKGPADNNLEQLISSSLDELNKVSDPRHVMIQLPCNLKDNIISIDSIKIESSGLAERLYNCTGVYIFAATLGAEVDRLIFSRSKIDSSVSLCIQACASAQIEDYCNNIENELSYDLGKRGLKINPRFSPGYSDFDISHQTDILRLLSADKKIGLCETKAHMLTPLKSVSGIIGFYLKDEK